MGLLFITGHGGQPIPVLSASWVLEYSSILVLGLVNQELEWSWCFPYVFISLAKVCSSGSGWGTARKSSQEDSFLRRKKRWKEKKRSWLWAVLCVCFLGGASGEEPACQCRRLKRLRFDPWVEKIPWRRACTIFLAGESHGQRILVG